MKPSQSLYRSLHNEGIHISISSLANFLSEEIWSNLTPIRIFSGDTDSNRFNDTLSIAVLPLLADTFPKPLHIGFTIDNPDQGVIKTVTTNASWPGDTSICRQAATELSLLGII